MKNKLTFLVGILVVAFLLVYMFTYQVRYNQVVVKTRFDQAGPDAIKSDPGLYFQWPWPIEKVEHYSKLLQVTDLPMEERKTRDGFTVVMRNYIAWSIRDPRQFFVTLKDDATARRQVIPTVQQVLQGLYGQYRFDQLVNLDPDKLKLRQIEEEARDQINAWLASQNYGMSVEQVGIRKLVLPEDTTNKVFEGMKQTRQRMAQNARSEGEAYANNVRSEALAAQRVILAFANGRASAIRAEGDQLAANSYALFQKDPEFAIFQRELEAMRKTLAINTTVIAGAADLGFNHFIKGPDAGPSKPASASTASPSAPAAPSPAGGVEAGRVADRQ